MCGEPTLLHKLQATKEAAKSPTKINKVGSCTLSQVPIASTSDQHRDCKPTLTPAHQDCPSPSYYIHFKSNGENLDDFVVQIDTPLLDNISITLFNQLIFDTPQLCCFLGHTECVTAYFDLSSYLYLSRLIHDASLIIYKLSVPPARLQHMYICTRARVNAYRTYLLSRYLAVNYLTSQRVFSHSTYLFRTHIPTLT